MTSRPAMTSDGITTKVSSKSVKDTVASLVDILAKRSIKLFAVIDQSAEAKNVGLELRQTVLVVFGSPVAGTPVMNAVPLAALDLPLKVLVWDDGGTTKVTYFSPDTIAERYGLPDELRSNLAAIDPLTDTALASVPPG